MSRVALIIDMDDTLADTQRHMLRWINARSKRQYQWDELNRDFREGKEHEYDRYVREILTHREHMEGIPPFEDALHAVERLYRAGYELHIVSSRREPLLDLTVDWLKQHGFAPYITTVHRRGNERGAAFKQRIASETGAATAFDDTYDVGEALASMGLTVYLIDKPWNSEEPTGIGLIRQPSFAAAVSAFLAK